LINDDYYVVSLGLSLLAFNIRREACGVLDGFVSFVNKYEKNKTHNMLSLMLNSKFKSLRLVSFVIG
jgi:hypothetical protein